MKQTPLHDKHLASGAKMVDFSTYDMPIQYKGIMKEHLAVRESAGIFDVSHMGEFIVSGNGAETFLDHVTINDVRSIHRWQAQYLSLIHI